MFARVKIGGWAVNEVLTSAQMNGLDIDHANAIDGAGGSAGTPYTPSTEIDINGAGLGFRLPIKSGTKPWPTFENDTGAKRTFKRRFPASPAARLSATMSITSGTFVQGDGTGFFTTILDIPDGATITNVRLYVKIAVGHGSLPTKGPGVSVQRLQPGASATLGDVLEAADTTKDGKTITLALPGTFGAYNALGEQFVDYPCDQNNTTDRGQYVFAALAQDENGGGAISGNIFSGWEVTFTLPKLAVDGKLQ
jgi:hypothetical protein